MTEYTSRSELGLGFVVLLKAGLLLAAPWAGTIAQEQTPPALGEVLDVQSATNRSEQQTQERVDSLADEARDLLAEYRLQLQVLDQAQRYNANLQRTVADQEREQASLTRQIDEFGDLERGIVPLMLDMVDALERFVRLDMPFQLQEREDRVRRLRELMDRADVSVAEKYRRIMDAYQVEAEFGRNIEAYAGALDTGSGPRQVEFLRIGRTILAYLTPDREAAGYWDAAAGEWRPLPSRYHSDVRQGLRIARKQAAPQILTLPVAAPRDVAP